MKLEISHLGCGYGKKKILSDISVTVQTGDHVCILGPNGVGKTTFFKTMLGHIPKKGGEIKIDGKDFHSMSMKERAQYVSYVPQFHATPFAFTVLDVVVMGRISHLKTFSSPQKKDINIAYQALEKLGIEHLASCIFTEISGGEKQMVLIARALAQEAKFMILDEPTASLDFGNQMKVLEVLDRLAAEGLGVVLTTHMPDHVFLLHDAKAVMIVNRSKILTGNAEEIVTAESLSEAYEVPVLVKDVDINHTVRKVCVTVNKFQEE